MQKKKLLGSTLALAVVFSTVSANAELLKNFKLSGELDLQATAGDNIKDFSSRPNSATPATANNDRIGTMQTMLLLNADWDLLDDVHSKITLAKNDRDWGNVGTAGNHGNTQSQPLEANAGGNVLGSVFVDQAYVKIDKVFGAIDTTLGRQFYGTQGDIVAYFGPRTGIYGMPIQALDTARFDWASDMVGVTGLVGKIKSPGGITATDQADIDLRGLIATIKANESISGSAYVYDAVTHATGGSGNPTTGLNSNLWLAGLRGKVAMGPAYASAEYDKNFGEDRSAVVTSNGSTYTGWAAKLDAGVKADVGVATLNPWGEFDYSTGQGDKSSSHNNAFTPIAGDYRAGDIYTRFNTLSAVPLGSGIAGLPTFPNYGTAGVASNNMSNLVNWGLGAKVTPGALNKLTVGAQYWNYNTQTSATPTANNGKFAAFNGNRHIGSEADVDLWWKHSENVTFDAGLGRFWAGGLINEAMQGTNPAAGNAATGQGVNPATAYWFDASIKF